MTAGQLLKQLALITINYTHYYEVSILDDIQQIFIRMIETTLLNVHSFSCWSSRERDVIYLF
jgi:hypothetical protein